MKSKFSFGFIVGFLIVVTLSACGGEQVTETPQVDDRGPVETYWDYWELCDAGRRLEAAAMLTETARPIGERWGACSFMHDYSIGEGQVPEFNQNLLLFMDREPELFVEGDTASLIWVPEEGAISPMVVMKFVDGQWKINELILMT